MDTIEHKKGKIFYSMGEVAEMFDVNPTLIRFWESKFDILRPGKDKKGNRRFTPKDVDNLKLIYHLVKEKGMTLAGAQKRIKQNPEGIANDMEVVERLQKIRAILVELREELKSDGTEVYHEEGLDEDNTMAEVKPAKKVRAPKPKASKPADIMFDVRAGEQWVGDELAKLDTLDENIEELVREDDIPVAEADELLEQAELLPLGADDAGTEITEEEMEMLDDEPEPDYPGDAACEAGYRPPFEEQSLFGQHEPARETRQETAEKPRIVEQTLF